MSFSVEKLVDISGSRKRFKTLAICESFSQALAVVAAFPVGESVAVEINVVFTDAEECRFVIAEFMLDPYYFKSKKGGILS